VEWTEYRRRENGLNDHWIATNFMLCMSMKTPRIIFLQAMRTK
jgi:hypothetical protein